ncbi:MAG: hypothetical protein OXC40_01095, partial [Proteobacteria bacterium]|nr:hypothetical protein [Pseudomonadota bacterium]
MSQVKQTRPLWHVISAVKKEAAPTLDVLDMLDLDYQYHSIGVGPLAASRSLPALLEQSCENIL